MKARLRWEHKGPVDLYLQRERGLPILRSILCSPTKATAGLLFFYGLTFFCH